MLKALSPCVQGRPDVSERFNGVAPVVTPAGSRRCDAGWAQNLTPPQFGGVASPLPPPPPHMAPPTPSRRPLSAISGNLQRPSTPSAHTPTPARPATPSVQTPRSVPTKACPGAPPGLRRHFPHKARKPAPAEGGEEGAPPVAQSTPKGRDRAHFARLSSALVRMGHASAQQQERLHRMESAKMPLGALGEAAEGLEAAESALTALLNATSGGERATNRAAALLRQVDKESALDAASRRRLSCCCTTFCRRSARSAARS